MTTADSVDRLFKAIEKLNLDENVAADLFLYISCERTEYVSNVGPMERMLTCTLNSCSTNMFKACVLRAAKDAKKAQSDPEYAKIMGEVYARLLREDNAIVPLNHEVDTDVSAASSAIKAAKITSYLWTLTLDTRRVIVRNAGISASRTQFVSTIGGGGQIQRFKAGKWGTIVTVVLAATELGYTAVTNINRWLKGEISGRRCAKNILDTTFTVGAGIGGGWGGAMLCAPLGPVGLIVGGVIGGVLSSIVAEKVVDYLTQKIFNLPREEALENAFRYFGLRCDASNGAINTAYRQKCLEHHPDRQGGDVSKFLEAQNNMEIIRIARSGKD